MSTVPPAAPATEARTSRYAIASLVCGIVGPCTVGLASVAGIILGIVGLVKIKDNPATMKGHGLAIAGIVVSGLGILLLPVLGILVAIAMPAFISAREAAGSAASKNNVRQLCMTAQQYGLSNRDKLPPADTWPEVFQQMGITRQLLADPDDANSGRSYAMNATLAGGTLAIRDPARTVLFFECRPGAPPSGGPDLLPERPRHGNRYIIGFVDCHVESVPPENIGGLIWEPKAGQ